MLFRSSVANSKSVSISGLTLNGVDAGNYNLLLPSLTANITAKSLTLSNAVANNKEYDGNTSATITATLNGVIAPDVVNLNGTGTFASSAIGTGIAVTSTSTLSGADAGNYSLTQPTGLTANITIPVCSTTSVNDTIRWNFTGGTASPSNSAIANITVSDLSIGNCYGTITGSFVNGTSSSSGYTGASGGSNAGVAARTSISFNKDSAAYFEFTVTPTTNNSVTLTSLSFGSRST